MKTFAKYVRGNELYPFDYIEYYEANILNYVEVKGKKLYEGITVNEFKRKYEDGFLNIEQIKEILHNERLSTLQDELIAEDKPICIFNLYILCMYLVMKARTQYVLLLEPTIEDILEKKISSITFNYEDGSSVESSKLANEIKDILANYQDKTYKVKQLTTWDKVSNKALVNSYFVHDLAEFLHRYFPVKRKKDALISTKEVELILYMLKLMGLVPEEPTNKRFWHLMAYYKKVYVPIMKSLGTFHFEEYDIYAQLAVIPYKIWNTGKINWENIQPLEIKIGDTIQFQLENGQFFILPIANYLSLCSQKFLLYFCSTERNRIAMSLSEYLSVGKL